MPYQIKNSATLNKILWVDYILGTTSGLVGLIFTEFFVSMFGLSSQLIVSISTITFLYSVFALRLARMEVVSIPQLRILIYANWAWTIVSLIIIAFHFSEAALIGQLFLMLQIILVGGLAWLEGNQLEKTPE